MEQIENKQQEGKYGDAWLAQSVERATPDLGVLSLRTMLGMELTLKKKENMIQRRPLSKSDFTCTCTSLRFFCNHV